MQKQTDVFDAVVVGSGATGGWAAKQLTEAGWRVAMLEAGRRISPKEFSEHKPSYEMEYLGRSPHVARLHPVQISTPACTESNHHWFVNDFENPYRQEKPFTWVRMRVVGGRTLSWGRQSFRYSDLDFRAASHDGYGDDWPISYADVAPYYEKVERFIGVSGQAENLPQLPDGVFQPPMEMTCGELAFKKAVEQRFGRRVTMGRAAILTRELNGRPACHYCGPCNLGCVTSSYFSSPPTTIAAAGKTGRLTLVTDAIAARVLMKDGKATGVEYVDSATRDLRQARGKIVILCASSLESVRLMLNSGIGNSSGVLGHYIMDHIFRAGASGTVPGGEALAWHGPPIRPNSVYIPRFRNVSRKSTDGFIRGYGYQTKCSPSFDFGAPGFGAAYKNAVRKGKWTMQLTMFGECLARKDNRVEIDPELVDKWGIPALKMNVTWSDNELKLQKDGKEQAEEMLLAAGATGVKQYGNPSVPGASIHEIGGARMGADRRTSVLNRYNQSHDVPNLFVTDGAAFVSSACQNPTLTMMALTVRACDYIIHEYAKKM
ncbi:MAG TPA: GMC family oxidoreductase [Bryobacteraceae bacterium]|nr:GMC family oxidoreductase [Bryobacteraceae bacterium]